MEYYDYLRFSTYIENSWYFWEMIATERLEKVSFFLQKYRDFRTVVFKEYYNYSPICAYAESCRYFWETIMTIKMYINNRIEERDT